MKRYDLNLLLSLDALLRERSVSGAAKRLGIGQPAMSAALGRLRALFDDRILVRGANGMEPTPRAQALSERLRGTLAELATMIEPARAFSPLEAERTFSLSGGDYVGMTLFPEACASFSREAPGIDLRFRYLEKDNALAALDQGIIDLAFLVNDNLPARFGSEVVIEETFVGAARVGHSCLDGPMTAMGFAKELHLLVTERGDATGCVDTALAAAGLKRRIAVTVPSAALVADILQRTDLIATVPRRAGERIAHDGTIRLFDIPVAMPRWSMRSVWAARNAEDPALLWLRKQFQDIGATAL
jgi:DNA-binding transcriptional LysR family regulator